MSKPLSHLQAQHETGNVRDTCLRQLLRAQFLPRKTGRFGVASGSLTDFIYPVCPPLPFVEVVSEGARQAVAVIRSVGGS